MEDIVSPKKITKETSNPTLPFDLLLLEIFPRLPIKSLIRFKTVCKQWLSTISSPEFAKLHLETSNDTNHRGNNHGVLIATNTTLLPPTKQLCGFLTYNYNINNDHHTLKIRFHHRKPPYINVEYIFMGSCNGLVCFWLRSQLNYMACLWNPITRERRFIQKPRRNQGEHQQLHPYKGLWCLGYIRASDDYKLVNIHYHPLGGKFLVSVYTLRSNKWNQYMSYSPLADSTFKTYFTPPNTLYGININNVISHWVVNTKGTANGYFKPSILAFDMVNESFDEVPLPSQLKCCNPCEIKLGISSYCLSNIKDNLCIIGHYETFSQKAWELKCYGDWGSWTNIFEVDVRESFPSIHISDLYPFPLNISKEGFQFFLMYWMNSKVWLIYKSNDQGYKCLLLEGLYPAHQLYSHVESLVSPFIGEI